MIVCAVGKKRRYFYHESPVHFNGEEQSIVSPPGFSPQAYVMPLLLSFLFFFFFLTIAWSKEIYETTRPIFTKFLRGGRHVGVDVNLLLVSGSVKGRCHATTFRREIDRNRRHVFLLETRIPQRMAVWTRTHQEMR